VGSSRRKLQQDATRALQPSFEQLHLPWLCPAFLEAPRRQQSIRRSVTSISRPASPVFAQRPQSPRRVASARATLGRSFATPATAFEFNNDEYIPFDNPVPGSQAAHQYPWNAQQRLSELTPIDPQATSRIPDEAHATPRRFHIRSGIGGDISDIHATLQAYLDVGQLDRASLTIRRLHDIYRVDAPELFHAHLAYIATVVSNIMVTGDSNLSRHLDRWFNEDVRMKGVKPNGTMIRLLIQGALGEQNRKKVDRTIRRYLNGAKREGILEESVEELSQFLTEEEFAHIREASPEYFKLFTNEAVTAAIEPLQDDVSIPAVRAQQQKGMGLISLRKSLAVFAEPGTGAVVDALQGADQLAWKQERLEADTISSAVERWRFDHEETIKRSGSHSGLRNRKVGAMMWKWHEALVPLIKEELQKIEAVDSKAPSVKDGERLQYGPFLQYLTPEKLSAVTVLSSLQTITRSEIHAGVPLARLVSTIGKAIEDESSVVISSARTKQFMAQKMPREQRLRHLAHIARKNGSSAVPDRFRHGEVQEWSATIQGHVGVTLVSLLFQAARREQRFTERKDQPAKDQDDAVFTNTVDHVEGRRVGIVRLHDEVAALIAKEPVGSAIAKHLPMLTTPVPWTGFKSGGFVQQSVPVVRMGSVYTQTKDYIKLASESGDMKQVFAALDVLGRTAWKVNRGVFDVMIQVWNSGEAVANIPPAEPKLEYPPEPMDKTDIAARRMYAYQCKNIDNLRDGMHSNRCFQNFQLEVARAFLNETFYFPHNMDFRGRAYPIPPYLNHMGADHCRGLLTFGKGKPLGVEGLAWLRVHIANVFGFDKASIIERRDFATKHMAEIYDSALNPMDGKRWWLEAECPWQCLAACIELKNALDLPDPTKYVSSLPIHQDGTCNGLQHYAALGGDSIGAKQVNLEPGDRPADIYTAVANAVASQVATDAAAGDELAKILKGKITRKVVKQTVMTNVYGVTFAGAKVQVKNRLDELYPKLFPADQPQMRFQAASYIARATFTALSAMFNGAHDIQYWLGECASRICESLSPQQIALIESQANGQDTTDPRYRSNPTNRLQTKDEESRFRSSVIWTTPLRMPVVQPYRKSKSKTIKTNLQQISLAEPSIADPVSKRKQLQAFPPNFIHSLDATHMFLSALKCDELGLTFAAVHDSFWTHAGDIDTMNTVLRDAFVRMHSEDIVARLAAEFAARYSGHMYLASVKKDTDLGRKIAKAKGFSSSKPAKAHLKELIVEKRRQSLLASEDPAERAEGEAMLTPAKVYEERVGDEDEAIIEKLDGAIGEIKVEEEGSESSLEADQALLDANNLDAILPDPTRDMDESLDATEEAPKVMKKKQGTPYRSKVFFWMPLTFPRVPKKVSLFDL
jgi:DNA-directed RNA polymerase